MLTGFPIKNIQIDEGDEEDQNGQDNQDKIKRIGKSLEKNSNQVKLFKSQVIIGFFKSKVYED